MGLHIVVLARSELGLHGLLSMLSQVPDVEKVSGAREIAAARQVIGAEETDAACILSSHFPTDSLLPFVADVKNTGATLVVIGDSLSVASRIGVDPSDLLLARSLTVPQLRAALEGLADTPRHHSAVQLTEREKEVLAHVYDGLGNKQIAHVMGISIHGVKQHVSRVLAKLNCTNRTAAVTRALHLDIDFGRYLRARASRSPNDPPADADAADRVVDDVESLPPPHRLR